MTLAIHTQHGTCAALSMWKAPAQVLVRVVGPPAQQGPLQPTAVGQPSVSGPFRAHKAAVGGLLLGRP